MDDPDFNIINSPLSQLVRRDGKQVHVAIYGDGECGWLLEVEDEHGNSVVWEDSFRTDQEALDEALKIIDSEGIDALIGPPSARSAGLAANARARDDAFAELADFLDAANCSPPCMAMTTLEGFLTAVIIGPRLVLPSEWLPWVSDIENGENEFSFDSHREASLVYELIMQKYDSLIDALDDVPAPFQPTLGHDEIAGAHDWCAGFLCGMQFCQPVWSRLIAKHPGWFTPFVRLGDADGFDITLAADDAQVWIKAIPPAVHQLRAYWRDHPQPMPAGMEGFPGAAPLVRAEPKIGRNAPCPCGSGKKYKHCCAGKR